MSPASLSPEMKDLLCSALAYEQDVARFNPQDDGNVPPTVPVKAIRGSDKKTRSDSASFSRRLRRLEAHGLLMLCNVSRGITRGPNVGKLRIDPAIDKRTRTDHVMLTSAGRALARQLAGRVSSQSPAPAHAVSNPVPPLSSPDRPPTDTRPQPGGAFSNPDRPPLKCRTCQSPKVVPGLTYQRYPVNLCDNCLRTAMCIDATFSWEVQRQLGRR